MPYRRLPSLLALRAFESAARNGSMKKAAEELNVTPGAVSQLVKKLEEQLETELLMRINRGFELTIAGARLKAGLSDAFIRMKEVVEEIRPETNNKSLLVACGPPFAAKWLVPRLCNFLEKHPDIDIRITSSFDKVDYAPRQIDIGIRLTKDEDDSLERIWLGEESMMALASPEFIERQKLREPKDMLRVPILSEDSSEHYSNGPFWPDWFEAVGLPKNTANRGINFGQHAEQALDAAVSGAGIVLGRKALASADLKAGRLVCPFGPELKTGLSYQIVCRKQIAHTDQAIAFKDWLVSELGASLESNPPVQLRSA